MGKRRAVDESSSKLVEDSVRTLQQEVFAFALMFDVRSCNARVLQLSAIMVRHVRSDFAFERVAGRRAEPMERFPRVVLSLLCSPAFVQVLAASASVAASETCMFARDVLCRPVDHQAVYVYEGSGDQAILVCK